MFDSVFSLSLTGGAYAPADFAGQRLPLEGKLSAKPTDEVENQNGEKAGTSVKNAGFVGRLPCVKGAVSEAD